MEYTLNDGVLSIQLPERLTADKYVEVRSGVFEIIGNNTFDTLIIDLLQTSYVSSSGLRIIIELMKKFRNMSVINTNLEVYDVFEMTGLTELITVAKAKKQVSVDGCPLIGRGGNGEVYKYNEDTIVKVYFRPGIKLDDIERERQLARKAFVLGVPTALTLDTVMVGSHYGVMYEMIGADSILGLIYKNPENYDPYILKFADGMKLINSIHTNRDPILADKKKEFMRWKNDVSHLFSPWELVELDKMVNAIPDEDTLVHGDFQLANVMLQGDQLLLIDMDTLGYGSKLFELANFYFSMKGIRLLTEPLVRLEEKDAYYCWNLAVEHVYEGVEETVKQRELILAEAICFLRLLRYGMRHDSPSDKMHLVKTELLNRIALL